jgi:hypothetical protein
MQGRITVATDKRSELDVLSLNTGKALRRAKKLETTLLKVVAQSEPGSAAEDFLKAVQQGTRKLKKVIKGIDRSLSSSRKRSPARREPASKPDPVTDSSPRPVRRARKKVLTVADQPDRTPRHQ